LIKGSEFDLTDKKGYGHPDGNVKFGAGTVFSEAQKLAADQQRFISSGWATTVGVVGWSLGGGHGPMANSKGLGVDNILEVEIVNADGNLRRVNSTSNADLFWALRGGGGSAWGVITSITMRLHKIPLGGFTFVTARWQGPYCDQGQVNLTKWVKAYE
jgi:ribonuclease T2